MESVTLRAETDDGTPIQATYLPSNGMNLISFKRGAIEAIDPSTRSLFDERNAGLGALIGPHFHQRPSATLPLIDESLFPHIARIRSKGVSTDPFSHGVGRYAPWSYDADATTIHARLTGNDNWNGLPLHAIQGQQFTLDYKATLTPQGLHIDYSVTSSNDSIVGLHYYYHLPQGYGTIHACVKEEVVIADQLQPIPDDWSYDATRHELTYLLDSAADYTLRPYPDPLHSSITIDAITHRVVVAYSCQSEENSWQLYRPAAASFVCVEPLSAQNPRHPNLTASALSVDLQLLPP